MVKEIRKEPQASEGNAKHYLHLKEVEITFKHDRPKRAFKVILDVQGDRVYESEVFKKTDEIRWEKGIYLKPTAILNLTLKVLYGTRMKINIHSHENYARATLDLAKRTPLDGSREILIEDDPQVIIKITFGDPLPLEAVVRLLGDETTSALESKVKLLEKTETALSVSEVLVDLVGAAGQAVPGGDAITLIAKTVFERCKNLNEAHNTAIVMMDNINAFLPLINRLKVRAEERETKAYLDKLLELIKDILDVLSKYSTSNHTKTSFYMRNWVNSKKATFDGLQKRVDEMRKNINTYLQAKTERNTTNILDNQQKQLLDILNPVSSAVYYDPNRGCLEGTRKKVLSDILGKLESEGDGPTACWVRGPAGIGKSTISISLAEILKKSGRLGGCFIFDRNIPERREPRNVLPTLAHSLALVYPPYRAHVMSVLKNDREIAKKSTVEQLSSLFPSNKIELPETPFVFVLDALDECALDEKRKNNGAPDREETASRFMELAKNIPWLRFVITSRPNIELYEVFENIAICRSVTSFDLIMANDVWHDIYKFNKAWLKSVRGLDKEWTESGFVRKLTGRANGLFIWSSTVRDYVQNDFDCNLALKRIMENTETHSEGPFATLDRLYHFVLEQAGGNSRQVLRIVLGVVAFTNDEALPQNVLFKLIPHEVSQGGLTEAGLKNIFGRLQSVLYIDNNGVVRIYHPSFLDFLNTKDRANDFWTDTTEINVQLVQQCMHLMNDELKFNICQLDSAYVLNSEQPDLQVKISTNIPEYLQYVCVHWIKHFLSMKDSLIQDQNKFILKTVRDFLRGVKSLFWLEAMSLMKEVEAATDALSHCFHTFDDEELASVARDLYRFATKFSDVIESSAPHIYISALSWAPVDSYPSKSISVELLHQPAAITSGKARRWDPVLWLSEFCGRCEFVRFSPDGNHLTGFSQTNGLIVLDTRTERWVDYTPPAEEFPDLNLVHFSLDDKNILMCNLSGTLLSYNIATREKTVITLEDVNKVDNFCLSPVGNDIAIISETIILCICDLSTKKCKFGPIDLCISVSCIRYSPKGEYLVIGFADGSIQTINPIDGALKECFLPDEWSRGVEDFAFSPNSGLICSMYSDSIVLRVWNIFTGRLVNELIHTTNISSVTFTPDGRFIIIAGTDGSIYFWQVMEEREEISPRKFPLSESYGQKLKIFISPDGRYLVTSATCPGDRGLRLLSLPDALRDMMQQDDVGSARLSRVSSIDCSPNGTIVSTHRDRSIFLWNMKPGQKSGEPILGIHTFAQFSPSGDYIVSCNGGESIIVWNAKTKEQCRTLDSTETITFEYCFYSHDGRYIIALATLTKRIYVWDSASGECLRDSGDAFIIGPNEVLGVRDYDVHDFTVSPIKNHVIFMDFPLQVHYVYDFLSGTIIFTIKTPCTSSGSVSVYSPDGMEIANIQDDELSFYDALTGSVLGGPITLRIEKTMEVIYSADGKHLILATVDSKIWIFDKKSQKIVIGPIRGHTEYISRMKLSRPDGRYLVTGSIDGTVRIWDTDFIMKLSKEDLNSVINVYEDGTHSIGVKPATAVDEGNTIARRILPQSITKDGWYRNADGDRLFWIPREYRMDAIDRSETCLPATARHELNFDLERLARFEGPNWVNIYPG